MSTITERVAAGAAFLDEHDPEWWREGVDRAIDLGTLDLSMGNVCVLGQRCPLETVGRAESAYYALAAEMSGETSEEKIDDWAAELGFQSISMATGPYEDLTAEWKRVITERRAS